MKEQTIDIEFELLLLKTMSYKKNFEKYKFYYDNTKLSETSKTLLNDYSLYFNTYKDEEDINWSVFYGHFSQNWHQELNAKDLAYYKDDVFPRISSNNIECIDKVFEETYSKKILKALADSPMASEATTKLLDKFLELRENLNTKSSDVDTSDSLDFNKIDKTNGIPWFLRSLQNSLGSLIQGQFVVVSADIGTGKSAFVISQVVHTLKHVKYKDLGPVLFFNSEGTSEDVFGRLWSNLYRRQIEGGFEEIVLRNNEIKDIFNEEYTNEKMLVSILTPNSLKDIEVKITKYKPSLVIIDMADTLAKDEDVQSLKKVYDHLRRVATKHCPIIATSQAGDQTYYDGEGKLQHRKWLGLSATYGSKTGKGGAAETLITIGKDEGDEEFRYISIPKKKRGKTANISCILYDKYSRYEELEW